MSTVIKKNLNPFDAMTRQLSVLHHCLEYIEDHRLNLSLPNFSNINVDFDNKLFEQGIPHRGCLKNQVLTHPWLSDMECTHLLIELGTDMDMVYPPISELRFLSENPPADTALMEMPQVDLIEAALPPLLTATIKPAVSTAHVETSVGPSMELGEGLLMMLLVPSSCTSITSQVAVALAQDAMRANSAFNNMEQLEKPEIGECYQAMMKLLSSNLAKELDHAEACCVLQLDEVDLKYLCSNTLLQEKPVSLLAWQVTGIH